MRIGLANLLSGITVDRQVVACGRSTKSYYDQSFQFDAAHGANVQIKHENLELSVGAIAPNANLRPMCRSPLRRNVIQRQRNSALQRSRRGVHTSSNSRGTACAVVPCRGRFSVTLASATRRYGRMLMALKYLLVLKCGHLCQPSGFRPITLILNLTSLGVGPVSAEYFYVSMNRQARRDTTRVIQNTESTKRQSLLAAGFRHGTKGLRHAS